MYKTGPESVWLLWPTLYKPDGCQIFAPQSPYVVVVCGPPERSLVPRKWGRPSFATIIEGTVTVEGVVCSNQRHLVVKLDAEVKYICCMHSSKASR